MTPFASTAPAALARATLLAAILGCGLATAPVATAATPAAPTVPAVASVSNVSATVLAPLADAPVARVQAGQAIRVRVRWIVAGVTAKPEETVTWRVSRGATVLYSDSGSDTAANGTWHADRKVPVTHAWTPGVYLATGTVTVAGHLIKAQQTFTVVSGGSATLSGVAIAVQNGATKTDVTTLHRGQQARLLVSWKVAGVVGKPVERVGWIVRHGAEMIESDGAGDTATAGLWKWGHGWKIDASWPLGAYTAVAVVDVGSREMTVTRAFTVTK